MNVFCYVAHMPDLLVQFDVGVTVRGTTTSEGQEVLSVIDFINIVCKKSGNYARQLWSRLKKSFEMEGLVVIVRLRVSSPPSPYKQPVVTRLSPAMTRTGLQFLLVVLGDKVKLHESAWTRFMALDRSMITEFDFNSLVPRK